MAALSKRVLNRALLARQWLLERQAKSALEALEQLIALQAQQARPPFVGLWTRLADFAPSALTDLLRARKVVRTTALRATLHLMTAADYLRFRSALQPAMDAALASILNAKKVELELDAVEEAAAECFAGKPQTFADLRATLASRYPALDERAMGYLARMRLPLAMLPDDSEFGFRSDSTFVSAVAWLKQPLVTSDGSQQLVLRYLQAFGPATVADAQAWSGLPKLKPVFEALRPQLESFRYERQRELFDVPGAPRPDESTPAAVRFLPGFDNAILGHADRSRIIADEHRSYVATKNLQVLPTFLVDGFVAGTWEFRATKKVATLELRAFSSVAKKTKQNLTEEGERLSQFLAPGMPHSEILFTNR